MGSYDIPDRVAVMNAIDEAFARHLVEVFAEGARHLKSGDTTDGVVAGLDRALQIRERMMKHASSRFPRD